MRRLESLVRRDCHSAALVLLARARRRFGSRSQVGVRRILVIFEAATVLRRQHHLLIYGLLCLVQLRLVVGQVYRSMADPVRLARG